MTTDPGDRVTPDVTPLVEWCGGAEALRHVNLQLCEQALALLGGLLDGLLENAGDALFEKAGAAADQETLRECFNTMRVLKTQGSLLSERFRESFCRAWFEGPAADASAATAGVATAMEGASRRARMLFSPLLRRLAARLGDGAASGAGHPLDPGRIALVFWQSTGELGLSEGERLLLLPLFRRFVMDGYGPVLAEVSAAIDGLEG
jgi:hypothetical protein